MDKRFFFIKKGEDGVYLEDGLGFILDADEMNKLGKDLIEFSNNKKNQILLHNTLKRIEFNEILEQCEQEETNKSFSNIYILKCAGKYKIGVSKNIELRVKQLTKSPFSIEVVYKNKPTKMAYLIEKRVHNMFFDNKIIGEWFDFTDYALQEIVKFINNEVKSYEV